MSIENIQPGKYPNRIKIVYKISQRDPHGMDEIEFEVAKEVSLGIQSATGIESRINPAIREERDEKARFEWKHELHHLGIGRVGNLYVFLDYHQDKIKFKADFYIRNRYELFGQVNGSEEELRDKVIKHMMERLDQISRYRE